MSEPRSDSMPVCPWCGSTDPAHRKPRIVGVLCNSAWHSDHPEHERYVAQFGRSVSDG